MQNKRVFYSFPELQAHFCSSPQQNCLKNCDCLFFFSDTAYLLFYLSRIDSRGDSQAWKSKIIEHEFVRSRALESFVLTRAGLSFIPAYKGHSSSPSDGIRTSPHHWTTPATPPYRGKSHFAIIWVARQLRYCALLAISMRPNPTCEFVAEYVCPCESHSLETTVWAFNCLFLRLGSCS